MKEIVFLLEEESAKAMLESLLPRILHASITPRLIAFDGKQDLEKQVAKRIRFYRNPYARFLVLRDQDSFTDCKRLKAALLQVVETSGKSTLSMVRIACHELETFYIGDLRAVEQALNIPNLAVRQQVAKFRAPDRLANPSEELKKLTSSRYQKVSGSRAIGGKLDLDNKRSTSFSHLIGGIQKMQQELLAIP
jgi:hypothetical protein